MSGILTGFRVAISEMRAQSQSPALKAEEAEKARIGYVVLEQLAKICNKQLKDLKQQLDTVCEEIAQCRFDILKSKGSDLDNERLLGLLSRKNQEITKLQENIRLKEAEIRQLKQSTLAYRVENGYLRKQLPTSVRHPVNEEEDSLYGAQPVNQKDAPRFRSRL